MGKTWKLVVIGLCFLQFAATTYYVHQQRQISSDVKQGFEYIKKNTPEDALILYPEENLLLYGKRKIVWRFVRNARPGQQGVYSLLWTKNFGEMDELLRYNRIDYILIKKTRIHDEVKNHHTGGYPRSFVQRLSQLNGWVKVFDNPGAELWKRKDV
jgi:hypothetical protein